MKEKRLIYLIVFLFLIIPSVFGNANNKTEKILSLENQEENRINEEKLDTFLTLIISLLIFLFLFALGFFGWQQFKILKISKELETKLFKEPVVIVTSLEDIITHFRKAINNKLAITQNEIEGVNNFVIGRDINPLAHEEILQKILNFNGLIYMENLDLILNYNLEAAKDFIHNIAKSKKRVVFRVENLSPDLYNLISAEIPIYKNPKIKYKCENRKKLKDFIEKSRKAGFNDGQIKEKLKEQNWKEFDNLFNY